MLASLGFAACRSVKDLTPARTETVYIAVQDVLGTTKAVPSKDPVPIRQGYDEIEWSADPLIEHFTVTFDLQNPGHTNKPPKDCSTKVNKCKLDKAGSKGKGNNCPVEATTNKNACRYTYTITATLKSGKEIDSDPVIIIEKYP